MQPVARVLQHYYQVILGNFEELYRKNVVEQQRKALTMMRSSGGAGAATPGSQQAGINGNLPLGQQDSSGVLNIMGMMGQPIPIVQSPSVQQSDHQHQPTSSMSGSTSNIDGKPATTGYPAQASAKPMTETEQDGFNNKRKLASEEPDVKRARQKTGQRLSSSVSHVY